MWAEFICARGSFGPERSSGAWEPNRLCTSNPAQLDYEGCGGVPGGTNSVRLTTYLRAGLGLELGDETGEALARKFSHEPDCQGSCIVKLAGQAQGRTKSPTEGRIARPLRRRIRMPPLQHVWTLCLQA